MLRVWVLRGRQGCPCPEASPFLRWNSPTADAAAPRARPARTGLTGSETRSPRRRCRREAPSCRRSFAPLGKGGESWGRTVPHPGTSRGFGPFPLGLDRVCVGGVIAHGVPGNPACLPHPPTHPRHIATPTRRPRLPRGQQDRTRCRRCDASKRRVLFQSITGPGGGVRVILFYGGFFFWCLCLKARLPSKCSQF